MKLAIVIVALAACEPAPSASGGGEPRPAIAVPPRDVLDARFVDTIRTATEVYTYWGPVDRRPRAAPIPCAFSAEPAQPEQVRLSAAADGPHVGKLFYLYANDRDAYLSDAPIKPGFAIVKESYAAVPLSNTEAAARRDATGHDPRTVTVNRAHYTMGERTSLFAMVKVDAVEGTDHQWIYGILDLDFTVRAVGRIERCAKCHEDATHERLFGI